MFENKRDVLIGILHWQSGTGLARNLNSESLGLLFVMHSRSYGCTNYTDRDRVPKAKMRQDEK